MYQKIVLALFAGFIVIGCGGGGGSGGSGGVNDTTIPSSGIYNAADTEEIKYLKVINYARSKARECKNNDGSSSDPSMGSFSAASPLSFNSDLYNAALEHSIDMAESNTFSHDGSGTVNDVTGSNIAAGHKSTMKERIDAAGYMGYTIIGENIAGGQTTVEAAVHGLLESPGHCANIMNPNYKDVGMAHYEKVGSAYVHYWTQDFGG